VANRFGKITKARVQTNAIELLNVEEQGELARRGSQLLEQDMTSRKEKRGEGHRRKTTRPPAKSKAQGEERGSCTYASKFRWFAPSESAGRGEIMESYQKKHERKRVVGILTEPGKFGLKRVGKRNDFEWEK